MRFATSRVELYSWALARTLDLPSAEAHAMLGGRSTAARLEQAEAKLRATEMWLRSRLGIDRAGRAADATREDATRPRVLSAVLGWLSGAADAGFDAEAAEDE